MNATAPRPIRFIVEATTSQLQELMVPLLHWLTPRDHPTASSPPAPDEDEDQDADPPPASTADPPTHAPVVLAAPVVAPDRAVSGVPELPDHLQQRYYLGKLCKRTHRFEDTDYSVRKRSNHGCAICNEQYSLTPRAGRPRPQSVPVLRPDLPKHLGETCFLSPILCDDPTHRYRGTQFTLRFFDTEGCVQCTTSTHQLAGD